jgi:hypothetical protein
MTQRASRTSLHDDGSLPDTLLSVISRFVCAPVVPASEPLPLCLHRPEANFFEHTIMFFPRISTYIEYMFRCHRPRTLFINSRWFLLLEAERSSNSLTKH